MGCQSTAVELQLNFQRGMVTETVYTQPCRLKSWKPDIAWKWWKWTIGFWRDVENNTAFGIDIFPLEIVWRYEGYRP